jgi:hypothetical protein
MGYGMKYTKGGFPFKQDKKTGHASTTQERFNDAGDEIGFATQDKDGKSQHGPTKENLRILNAEKDEKKYGSQIKNNNNNTTKIFGNSPAPFKPKGMTGLTKQQKKNKRAKFSSDVKSFATGKKKALELKQGEHNSKEFQAKVEKNIELRDEGRTLPQYTRKKR